MKILFLVSFFLIVGCGQEQTGETKLRVVSTRVKVQSIMKYLPENVRAMNFLPGYYYKLKTKINGTVVKIVKLPKNIYKSAHEGKFRMPATEAERYFSLNYDLIVKPGTIKIDPAIAKQLIKKGVVSRLELDRIQFAAHGKFL